MIGLSKMREDKVISVVEDLLDTKGMPTHVYITRLAAKSKYMSGQHPRDKAQMLIRNRGPYPFDTVYILEGANGTLGAKASEQDEAAEKYEDHIIGQILTSQDAVGLVYAYNKSRHMIELGRVDLYTGEFTMGKGVGEKSRVAEDSTTAAREPKEIRPIDGSFETVEDLRRALEIGKFERR